MTDDLNNEASAIRSDQIAQHIEHQRRQVASERDKHRRHLDALTVAGVVVGVAIVAAFEAMAATGNG